MMNLVFMLTKALKFTEKRKELLVGAFMVRYGVGASGAAVGLELLVLVLVQL